METETQEIKEVNTQIYRVGDDMESEYFGNGTFSKLCRVNNEKNSSIYLKNLTSRLILYLK